MRYVLFAVFSTLVACGKGDYQKCDQMCRNYATIMYWDKVDKEIALAPADQREALKATKLAEFTQKLEGGLGFCISKCQAANNDGEIDCVIKAKTAAQVKPCAPTD